MLEPGADARLAVTRVPVQVNESSVAYLQDAVWVEKPSRLFQRLLGETIRARGGRLVVDQGDLGYAAATKLSGRLLDMGYDVASGSVVVRFDAMLQTPTARCAPSASKTASKAWRRMRCRSVRRSTRRRTRSRPKWPSGSGRPRNRLRTTQAAGVTRAVALGFSRNAEGFAVRGRRLPAPAKTQSSFPVVTRTEGGAVTPARAGAFAHTRVPGLPADLDAGSTGAGAGEAEAPSPVETGFTHSASLPL